MSEDLKLRHFHSRLTLVTARERLVVRQGQPAALMMTPKMRTRRLPDWSRLVSLGGKPELHQGLSFTAPLVLLASLSLLTSVHIGFHLSQTCHEQRR